MGKNGICLRKSGGGGVLQILMLALKRGRGAKIGKYCLSSLWMPPKQNFAQQPRSAKTMHFAVNKDSTLEWYIFSWGAETIYRCRNLDVAKYLFP